jgi:serine/threonine protein phosphatase PrpC
MGIRNYDNMENQDVVLSDQIFNKCKIYAIFDGHGEYGKMIAKTASTIFKSRKNEI